MLTKCCTAPQRREKRCLHPSHFPNSRALLAVLGLQVRASADFSDGGLWAGRVEGGQEDRNLEKYFQIPHAPSSMAVRVLGGQSLASQCLQHLVLLGEALVHRASSLFKAHRAAAGPFFTLKKKGSFVKSPSRAWKLAPKIAKQDPELDQSPRDNRQKGDGGGDPMPGAGKGHAGSSTPQQQDNTKALNVGVVFCP